MIDEVSDTLGWDRKHAIKALNGQVSLGQGARKRGSKATYSEEQKRVTVEIWKRSEQPCGKLLKPTIPLWLDSYEKHHGQLPADTRHKVLAMQPPPTRPHHRPAQTRRRGSPRAQHRPHQPPA